MKGLFITATDTGVGKTSVTVALTHYLLSQGVNLRVCKPVETGVDQLPTGTSDGERLQNASGACEPLQAVSPLRLPEPLAPALSAKRNGVTVCYATLLQQIQQQIEGHFSLVEGAGGLLVPLTDKKTICDLAVDLGLPLLVVIRPDLGTLNHTLLTIEAALQAGLSVAGYLINRMPSEPGPAEAGVISSLADFTTTPCLGVLSAVTGDFDAQTEQLTEQLCLSPHCQPLRDWLQRNC